MKIAVTYENGNVFQHFGRTEEFKVYEVSEGNIVSSEIMGTNGIGHEALAGLLADNKIDLLICGGMGQGAEDALEEAGISVVSGAEGDTDQAVQAFLRGELESVGVNCDHHDETHHHDTQEEAGCGGCGEGGAGCAGCPGCGPQEFMFEGKNVGKIVKVHYVGTFPDGEQFDSSYDRDKPLEFVCGAGMMIPGFDKAVAEMEPGEKVFVELQPEDAYGMPQERMIFTVERDAVEGSEDLEVGDRAYLTDQLGRPFNVRVTAKEGSTITFDANHEMAGKVLNFTIELLEII